MNLTHLSAPFPKESVHWRSQSLTRDGDKALALAYIDARHVMDRLDLVCGPGGWQSDFSETARGRVIARIGILVGDQWIWKADGAGDTAVEGEKGGISDALKRAAVSWGVGRYLYRLGSPWVPCKTREYNGKKHWNGWSENPWDFVKDCPVAPEEMARDLFQQLKAGKEETNLISGRFDTDLIKTLVPEIYSQHIEPILAEAA